MARTSTGAVVNIEGEPGGLGFDRAILWFAARHRSLMPWDPWRTAHLGPPLCLITRYQSAHSRGMESSDGEHEGTTEDEESEAGSGPIGTPVVIDLGNQVYAVHGDGILERQHDEPALDPRGHKSGRLEPGLEIDKAVRAESTLQGIDVFGDVFDTVALVAGLGWLEGCPTLIAVFGHVA
jgi:hypothetical protein